ncbi:hypothetical protein ACEN9F_14430 [Duganella sp. CT11-25]|uniref:hypothetical protein n=1 Tax=unclassified Duganella TaxID=2636909 RepID=UPI0039B05BC9
MTTYPPGFMPAIRKLLPMLLAASIAEASHAQARQQPAVFTENVAVIRLLKRFDLPPMIRQRLAHPPEADARLREVMVYMSTHATDDDIYRGMSPLYARHVSISDANRLSTGLANAQAYGNLKKLVEPEFDTALVDWCRDYYTERLAIGIKSIYAAIDRQPAGAPVPDVTPPPIGLPAVDQALALIAEIRATSTRLDQALEKVFRSPELGELLQPARLASPAGIARSRASLLKLEEQLESYLHEREKLQAGYRPRTEALFSDRKLRAGLATGWSALYSHEVAFAESERAGLDALRRVLDFAESRQGKIHLKDEQLEFDDDDDVPLFNAMLDQLEKAAEEQPRPIVESQGR